MRANDFMSEVFSLNSRQSRKSAQLQFANSGLRSTWQFDPPLNPSRLLTFNSKWVGETDYTEPKSPLQPKNKRRGRDWKVNLRGNDAFLRKKPQRVGGVKVFRRRLYLSQIKSLGGGPKKGKLFPAQSQNVSVILEHTTDQIVVGWWTQLCQRRQRSGLKSSLLCPTSTSRLYWNPRWSIRSDIFYIQRLQNNQGRDQRGWRFDVESGQRVGAGQFAYFFFKSQAKSIDNPNENRMDKL